jgi:hypothetical protein
LPLGQLVPFDETGIERLTHRGLRQSGGHDGEIAEPAPAFETSSRQTICTAKRPAGWRTGRYAMNLLRP